MDINSSNLICGSIPCPEEGARSTMTLPKMLMIGHSHLAALETAQMQRRASGTPASLPITVVQLRKPAYRMTPEVPPPHPRPSAPPCANWWTSCSPS